VTDGVFDDSARVFVSIASYRDPELVPTVRDCLEKARYPDRLRFGVCWQHDGDEQLPDWFGGEQFRVLDVDWRESAGACWARASIMDLWDGEDWYLQLDSHHRFARDWDVVLLDEAARTASERPVLTTYAPAYLPDEPEPVDLTPTRMEFGGFAEDGIPLFKPGFMPDWTARKRPRRARFASAHLLFAPGRFVTDVPYDPDLYFWGEEITLAVRAFTHGYDLFEPSRLIVWHEFTREYRPKHWEDHEATAAMPWYERDKISRAKVSRLFAEPLVGRFGLGVERTLADYEAYAGLSFRYRKIQDYTRRNLEPPNPPGDPDWPLRSLVRRVHVLLDRRQLPAEAFIEPPFWYVGFSGSDGTELYREDASGDELAAWVADPEAMIKITRSFEAEAEPVHWTVLPHGRDGWLAGLSGPLTVSYVGIHEKDRVAKEDAVDSPAVDSEDLSVGRSVTRAPAAIGEQLSYDPVRRSTTADVGRREGVHGENGDHHHPLPLVLDPHGAAQLRPRVRPGLRWEERQEGFEVRPGAGEGAAHVVNPVGMFLLELADGQSTFREIAKIAEAVWTSLSIGEIFSFFESAQRVGLLEVVAAEQEV
jgi:hypothetical protein